MKDYIQYLPVLSKASYVLSFNALLFSTLASANDEWTRLYEEDGIVVEQNKTEALPQFRASGILDLNFYEVFAVLADISR